MRDGGSSVARGAAAGGGGHPTPHRPPPIFFPPSLPFSDAAPAQAAVFDAMKALSQEVYGVAPDVYSRSPGERERRRGTNARGRVELASTLFPHLLRLRLRLDTRPPPAVDP